MTTKKKTAAVWTKENESGGPVIDISDKKVSVHVSGGGQSAIALARCLEWYGPDRVSAVFADTMTEAPDLYEFLDAQEKLFGISIIRLQVGGDIWDTFDKHGVISLRNAGGACKASVELKQKPLAEYMSKNHNSETTVIAAGLSWMESPEMAGPAESSRQSRLSKKLEPFRVIYPLNVPPRLSDCDVVEELERIGLPVPDAYRKGYPHNNCGGGCVLAGISQWIGLLRDYPERFAYHERREQEWQQKTGHGFTVLRDFRGDGVAKHYTLSQLRVDVEQGRKTPNDFRSGCSCMFDVEGYKQSQISFSQDDQ